MPGNFSDRNSDRDSDRRGFVFRGAAPYAPSEAVVHRKGHRKRGPPGGGKPRRVMWGWRDVRPVGTGGEAVYPQRGENAPLPLGGEETNGKESTAFFPVFSQSKSLSESAPAGARRIPPVCQPVGRPAPDASPPEFSRTRPLRMALTVPALPSARRPSPRIRACPAGRTYWSYRPPRRAGQRDSPPADSR